MKLKIVTAFFGALVALGALAQPQAQQPQIQLAPPSNSAPMTEPVQPDKSKLGYAIGMSVGGNIATTIKRQELDVDIDSVLQGMKDSLTGQPTRLSEKEVGDMLRRDLQTYMADRRKWQMQKLESDGAEAKKQGLDFLAKNVNAEGVKTLPDGLQYKVITEGNGATCGTNDMARVSYKGTLIDGTVFDENTNFNTRIQQVIKGWGDALSLMKVGSHWKLFVPSDLAYGDRAQPPKIAPNSVLIFDMELLGVTPMPPRPAFPPAQTISPRPTSMNSSNGGSVVSGQIIRVPSKAELDKGAKIEVIDPNSTNAASGK